jgi:hypothetical protein
VLAADARAGQRGERLRDRTLVADAAPIELRPQRRPLAPRDQESEVHAHGADAPPRS